MVSLGDLDKFGIPLGAGMGEVPLEPGDCMGTGRAARRKNKAPEEGSKSIKKSMVFL